MKRRSTGSRAFRSYAGIDVEDVLVDDRALSPAIAKLASSSGPTGQFESKNLYQTAS
jgi:hypothetical protein